MTTKAIQAVLEDYRDRMTDSLAGELSQAQRETDEHNLRTVTVALDELKRLREAAKTLDRLSIGDFTYKIRDRVSVIVSTHHSESTWNHPDVKAWSDASVLMAAIAKETP